MRPRVRFALMLFVLASPGASPGIEPIRIDKTEGYESPCWSPDGHRLAYAWWRRGLSGGETGNVAVRDLATGQTTTPQALPTVPIPRGSGARVTHPCWSADEASLFVTVRDAYWQVSFDSWDVLPASLPFPAGTRSPSEWSPNGQDHIVSLTRNGQTDLWIERPSTGGLWQLTNDPDVESEPDWSPDGTHIAYVAWWDPVYGETEIRIITDPHPTAVVPTSLSSVKARYR